MELKGLKVKRTMNTLGYTYPNFNNLAYVQALPQRIESGRNITWQKLVDIYGGWHIDQTSDAWTDSGAESPYGEQWGLLLMPKDFVTQAATMFVGLCVALDEAKTETFFDAKAHTRDPEENIDIRILQGIANKITAGIALTAHDLKAKDRTDDTPGITINNNKTWALYKEARGITHA